MRSVPPRRFCSRRSRRTATMSMNQTRLRSSTTSRLSPTKRLQRTGELRRGGDIQIALDEHGGAHTEPFDGDHEVQSGKRHHGSADCSATSPTHSSDAAAQADGFPLRPIGTSVPWRGRIASFVGTPRPDGAPGQLQLALPSRSRAEHGASVCGSASSRSTTMTILATPAKLQVVVHRPVGRVAGARARAPGDGYVGGAAWRRVGLSLPTGAWV